MVKNLVLKLISVDEHLRWDGCADTTPVERDALRQSGPAASTHLRGCGVSEQELPQVLKLFIWFQNQPNVLLYLYSTRLLPQDCSSRVLP